MKKNLYSIRDNKAGFWSPREDINDDTALRNFAFAVNTNELMMFRPNDYDLYFVGTFDDERGLMEPAEPIKYIASGGSVFNEK